MKMLIMRWRKNNQISRLGHPTPPLGEGGSPAEAYYTLKWPGEDKRVCIPEWKAGRCRPLHEEAKNLRIQPQPVQGADLKWSGGIQQQDQ